jgi:hypothetical protein
MKISRVCFARPFFTYLSPQAGDVYVLETVLQEFTAFEHSSRHVPQPRPLSRPLPGACAGAHAPTSDHEVETRRALVTSIAKGQSFTLYQPEPIFSGGIL